jgi:REP-associated tyrosine transposase
MDHTRVSLRIHCIFSTKGRRPTIPDGLQQRLFEYVGGIVRRLGMTAIAVGGVDDHLHVFILLSPTVALATAVQKIKANSSRWLHETTGKPFQWQEGYAAYSVSISHTDTTVQYILNQREHHKGKTFEAELNQILGKIA